jgi:hypothetical protein
VRSDRLHRHLLIGFVLALALYLGVFSCDQRIRSRKGPWQVAFQMSSNGEPSIRIDQPFLSISNVQVIFAGETPTNSAGTVAFDRPGKPTPFGRVKFEDLTYLPGSVAFDFFGHEVELLPRTLYLNKQEQAWQSGAVHRLEAGQKLPPEMHYDPKKKNRRFGS